ncbi:cell division cycle-associated protein 7-like isoform X2 [Vigna radiata var. radiata]|uniref:Cell division cycle-associated protein 7-like isoform X2 n=1 Tax=Vigna radiata var. radiata TaxID=3916 RepID=A0A3Q0EV43_VIGRR|nr:cell division cycle-associated protein 7-like isoform X2 [Vigna radiata var. radiata]
MQSHHLNDFPLDWFQEGISGYYKLDLSKKFKLMTFLGDEALNTAYGENAEEVAQLANWTCPKCRGICNCSFFQRRGEQPTGPLYRGAKESGFKSVAEVFTMKKNLETSNALNEGNLRKDPEVFLLRGTWK